MLDNSFLYQNDFDDHYEIFRKKSLSELYKSLYANGRLSADQATSKQELDEFLANYDRNLKLISVLAKENYLLQHRVHQLGVKNRIKKKLGRYKKPEDIKSYVSHSEMEDILSGSFVSKNYLPIVSFGTEAQRLFKTLSKESFEEGLRNIKNK